jgi:hypothetical protein
MVHRISRNLLLPLLMLLPPLTREVAAQGVTGSPAAAAARQRQAAVAGMPVHTLRQLIQPAGAPPMLQLAAELQLQAEVFQHPLLERRRSSRILFPSSLCQVVSDMDMTSFVTYIHMCGRSVCFRLGFFIQLLLFEHFVLLAINEGTLLVG